MIIAVGCLLGAALTFVVLLALACCKSAARTDDELGCR